MGKKRRSGWHEHAQRPRNPPGARALAPYRGSSQAACRHPAAISRLFGTTGGCRHFARTAVNLPRRVFAADDLATGPPIADSRSGQASPPAVVSPEEVPLPDHLQETSQDESLSSFRDCDFVSSDWFLSSVDCIFSDRDDQCSSVPLRGRLRRSINFWKSIGASGFVIRVLDRGYYLPFSHPPHVYFSNNHASARQHAEFVSSAIHDLVASGSAIPATKAELHMCSPLGVVEQNKLRLILDLRELNKCLKKVHSVKYDDVKTAALLLKQGDYFFTFDLHSAYHHIEIDPAFRKYLGFSWPGNDGVPRYFMFACLPFGLCTAPFVFSKMCKVLVRHWRANCWKP